LDKTGIQSRTLNRNAVKEKFMAEHSTRGGTHEQHVKAGEQSHKNAPGAGGTSHGGASGQQAKAGEQSQKDQHESTDHQRGGSHEQHVKAGSQSHKNG
jgi:hypothetical protein